MLRKPRRHFQHRRYLLGRGRSSSNLPTTSAATTAHRTTTVPLASPEYDKYESTTRVFSFSKQIGRRIGKSLSRFERRHSLGRNERKKTEHNIGKEHHSAVEFEHSSTSTHSPIFDYDGPAQSPYGGGSSYGGGQSSYGGGEPSFGSGFGSFDGIEGFNPTWFRGSAVARGRGYKKPNAYNNPVPPAPVDDSYGPPKAGYEKPLGIPAIEAPPPPPPVVVVEKKYEAPLPPPPPPVEKKYEAPLPPPPPPTPAYISPETTPAYVPPPVITTPAYVPPPTEKYIPPPPPPPPTPAYVPPPPPITTPAYVPPITTTEAYVAPTPAYVPPPPSPPPVKSEYVPKPMSSYGPPPGGEQNGPSGFGRGSLLYGFGSKDSYGRPSALGGYTRNFGRR